VSCQRERGNNGYYKKEKRTRSWPRSLKEEPLPSCTQPGAGKEIAHQLSRSKRKSLKFQKRAGDPRLIVLQLGKEKIKGERCVRLFIRIDWSGGKKVKKTEEIGKKKGAAADKKKLPAVLPPLMKEAVATCFLRKERKRSLRERGERDVQDRQKSLWAVAKKPCTLRSKKKGTKNYEGGDLPS